MCLTRKEGACHGLMEGTLAAGAIRALGTYQGFLQCEDSPYIKENLLKPESKHSKMESTEEEGKGPEQVQLRQQSQEISENKLPNFLRLPENRKESSMKLP